MKEIQKLPLSRTDFSVIRNSNMIYVDKTDMIASIARADSNVAFFLGRPRRFGKTLLVNTFEDLFTNGLKHFKGLKIDTQNLWTDTKTYPVLHLDFSDYKKVKSIEQFNKKFYDDLLYFVKAHDIEILINTDDPVTLAKNIFGYYSQNSLVLLIDEYDSALNASMLNAELFEEIRNVYSNFFSTIKTYEGRFRFIFITGITRYSHASIFSPFNIIYDLTLDTRYQTLLGYTDEELNSYFGYYLEKSAKALSLTVEELHKKLKDYYDGYHFNRDLKANLYCPFSILNFFNFPENGFANYWNESGAGTEVVNRYFKKYPVSCEEILKGFEVSSRDYFKGSNISDINYAVLLQQAGYYTFAEGTNKYDYIFKIPNKEVANIIYPLVFENETGFGSKEINQISKTTRNLVANLYEENIDEAQNNFTKIFDFNGYDAIQPLLETEAILRDFLFLIFNISLNLPDEANEYYIQREEINQKGRADIVIENIQNNKIPRIVIELKVAENEAQAKQKLDEALNQIKTRDYGNNGLTHHKNNKRYGVVFFREKDNFRKLRVLLKGEN